MNGKYLLDTNIIVPILNQETALLERIKDIAVYVPSIVLGELYYGARHSTKVNENLAKIETFKTRVTILVCDAETADHYGQIKQELRTLGQPIPENDIWIAALARQNRLPLVTRDTHFNAITNLQIEIW